MSGDFRDSGPSCPHRQWFNASNRHQQQPTKNHHPPPKYHHHPPKKRHQLQTKHHIPPKKTPTSRQSSINGHQSRSTLHQNTTNSHQTHISRHKPSPPGPPPPKHLSKPNSNLIPATVRSHKTSQPHLPRRSAKPNQQNPYSKPIPHVRLGSQPMTISDSPQDEPADGTNITGKLTVGESRTSSNSAMVSSTQMDQRTQMVITKLWLNFALHKLKFCFFVCILNTYVKRFLPHSSIYILFNVSWNNLLQVGLFWHPVSFKNSIMFGHKLSMGLLLTCVTTYRHKNPLMDIATYWLNRPRAWLSENPL